MSDSEKPLIPLAAEPANNPNAMRDRIAATLKSRWPAPWFGGERQHQQILDLADAVIAELKLRPTYNFTCCGEQPVGEYPELPTQLFQERPSQ